MDPPSNRTMQRNRRRHGPTWWLLWGVFVSTGVPGTGVAQCTPIQPVQLRFTLESTPRAPRVGDPVTLTVAAQPITSGLFAPRWIELYGNFSFDEGFRKHYGTAHVQYQRQAVQAGVNTFTICVEYDTFQGCWEDPWHLTTTTCSAVIALDVASNACDNDCSGDGLVTVHDLLTLVGIALGNVDAATCTTSLCLQRNEAPLVCLLQTIDEALQGCHSPVDATE